MNQRALALTILATTLASCAALMRSPEERTRLKMRESHEIVAEWKDSNGDEHVLAKSRAGHVGDYVDYVLVHHPYLEYQKTVTISADGCVAHSSYAKTEWQKGHDEVYREESFRENYQDTIDCNRYADTPAWPAISSALNTSKQISEKN